MVETPGKPDYRRHREHQAQMADTILDLRAALMEIDCMIGTMRHDCRDHTMRDAIDIRDHIGRVLKQTSRKHKVER